MRKRLAIPSADDWSILRMVLLRNHLQAQRDILELETQARQAIHSEYRQLMAQINSRIDPLAWATATTKHHRRLRDEQQLNQERRCLIQARQEQEAAELEKWINQQPAYCSELVVFDQLDKVSHWALSQQQQHQYHEALRKGLTLMLTDPNKSILWASRSFLSLTGYKPIDIVGKTARFLQGAGTDETVVRYIREQLNQARPVEAKLINYRKNGESYLCHLQIDALHNSHGKMTHFMATEYED